MSHQFNQSLIEITLTTGMLLAALIVAAGSLHDCFSYFSMQDSLTREARFKRAVPDLERGGSVEDFLKGKSNVLGGIDLL
jgi:hypothetical protein